VPDWNRHLIEQLRVAWESGDAAGAQAILDRLRDLLPLLYAAQKTRDEEIDQSKETRA
jgi:hypothetical protein